MGVREAVSACARRGVRLRGTFPHPGSNCPGLLIDFHVKRISVLEMTSLKLCPSEFFKENCRRAPETTSADLLPEAAP